MNGEELYALLQELPDDFITEAVVPYRKRRISLRVIIPAIAACATVLIARIPAFLVQSFQFLMAFISFPYMNLFNLIFHFRDHSVST